MMFRMRDFFIFLTIALLIMVQANIHVESTPIVTPDGKFVNILLFFSRLKPCPPCRGAVVKRISCYRACPKCAYH
ncbi:hypothetical protein C2G38_2099084 [Gigaspora rosea]|uniref:Uncharacterized protein n=1 Tax=Gigaspora rosea TaxID=44941 RepID=A0A397UVC6_9GLOM|nr:hypothetical protein C2G38_2099084 [Gigaspora rosea]